ncbi:MAG TPA: carboxypeptidase-like regulatory domain-containing protein [Terriglobales bacterium]|nr:carboxypeptidase-like regulatory domain-containing protein [Terriglobales bacterium]
MRAIRCFAAILAFTLATFAQVSQDATASVEGTVTDAKTSQTIRGAVITLTPISGHGSRSQATSDAAGRFKITGLQPGNYRAFIQARGFLPKVYGSTTQPSSCPAVSLKAGQALTGLSFALKPLGVIQGRVLNADGDPMVRCKVQALQVNKRRNQPRGMSSAQTDDRGEYRVFDLVPGDYYVIANCQGYGGLSMARAPGSDAVSDELSYVPVYYPGVTDIKQASIVMVRSADEVTVDISVARQRTYHVRGTVTGAGDQGEGPPAMALLVPRGLAAMQGPRGAAVINGKFDLPGVVPGSYALVVQAHQPNAPVKMAREEVEVGSTNVDGLSLVLAPLSRIRGVLRVDGQAPSNTDLAMLSVNLQAMESGTLAGSAFAFTSAAAQLKPDGSFELSEVGPGNYMVGLTANGNTFRDWYTKSVHFGGRDVTDTGFRIGSGATGTLEIVVTARGASVQGTVVDSNHHPVASIFVMAVPDEGRRKRWDLYDGSRTDDNGHFELRGLAAGSYSIVAAQDLDMDDRFDVDAMNKFAAEGTTVRLDEGDRKTMELSPSANVSETSE